MKFIYDGHSLKSGIYKIINTHTNRIYIGQAKEIKARWNGHKSSLLRSKHQNKFLMNDFSKCQLQLSHHDFLEFYVLEVMEGSTKEERNKREEWWIQKFLCESMKLYNIEMKPSVISDRRPLSREARKKLSKTMKMRYKHGEFVPWNKGRLCPEFSGASHPMFGKTHSESTKVKLQISHTGKKQSVETCRKRSVAMTGSGNPNYGKKFSDEYKKKLSSAHIGIQSGENHPMFGMHHSDETKRIIARSLRAKGMSGCNSHNAKSYEQLNLLSPTGAVVTAIECLTEFCKEHNLQPANLCRVLSGHRKSHKGWRVGPGNGTRINGTDALV
jgi:group I intron endonuclease